MTKRKYTETYIYICMHAWIFSQLTVLSQKILRWFDISFFFTLRSSIIIQFLHLVWQLHYIIILRQTQTYTPNVINRKKERRKKNILESYKLIKHKWSIVDLIHKIDDLSKEKIRLFFFTNKPVAVVHESHLIVSIFSQYQYQLQIAIVVMYY